jgi:broad specificity phosphatase PhoE
VRVTLVRHARSAPDPATPSHTWGLSAEGRRDALALRLDGVDRLLAGPEPRMASTVAHLGPVEVDAAYAESGSHGWLGESEFDAVVARYFAGEQPAPGWEPAADVVARFVLVDGAAIVSGGRAIAAVVAHHTGCDGLEVWRALRFPDVIHLFRDERDRWVASKP